MKKNKSLVAVGVFVLLAVSGFIKTPAAIAVDDAIIAVVNDEVITLRDLQEFIRSTYVGLVAEGMPDEKIKEVMLDLEINGINKLIEDKLIISRANKLQLEVRAKLIDERVDEVKKKYGSEKVFMEALISHGATLTELRNKVTEQLKIKYVIDEEVRSKIYINPQDVNKFYKENIGRFKQDEALMLDSIFIPSGNDALVAKQKSQEALDLISSGKDFALVANQYSSAPPIGRVERGKFVKDIEDKILGLNAGETSSIVEVPNGYYIFKVSDKIPAKTASLIEVKEKITNVLFNQKFNERYDKWLKGLKDDAFIEIKK